MSDDPQYAAWERGNLRGLGKKRRLLRIEKDADGNDVSVYEIDDDEWEVKYGEEQSGSQSWPSNLSRWPRS